MLSMINGTFCAKMSTVGENFLYQVSDGTEVVRSVVSPAGRLVDCSVTVNQMQVKSFVHECRLGLKGKRAGRQLETRFARMDEAKLMCSEFKKRSQRSGVVKEDGTDESALQHKPLKRAKRGFTYPGTLWCGAGNMADNYDQLGDFAETDSCCRTHDHCPHVIHAFSSNYGHTNFKWHSICHCDCDNALKDCLRKVNDTSSRVVGQAFFNVIGVPCFEFVYEEQCAERHWYGLCKQYEQLPVAVLKEAVPYDFGGIDVIDELTVAPPKRKDSKKSKEEEKPESTTQSTVSGPEEPSLTNVVTAAEDFIKFLATVSTSQSSTTADSDKGETQSSEKKKRKNTGKKKKTKKQKGKGKRRNRKQKVEASVRREEGGAVSPSGSRAEEVIALSNLINESHKHDQSSKSRYKVHDSEYELGRQEDPSNEVMKDEPAADKESVAVTSSPTVQKKPAESHSEALPTLTSIGIENPHRDKSRRLRKLRRKKSKAQDTDTTDNSSVISVPAIITTTPTAQAEQQSLGSNTETQPVLSAVNGPIVLPEVKKHRSKEREDREQRKKRRKVISVSPIVAADHDNSSADNLNTIPPTGAPTVPAVPRAVYGGKVTVHTALNSSFSVLKRQRSNERRLRNRRRKTVWPLSGEVPHFRNSTEHPPLIPTSSAANSPANAAVMSRLTEQPAIHSEWKLFTTAAPSINAKHQRNTIRRKRKPRQKVNSAALGYGYGVSRPSNTERSHITSATIPSEVATAEQLSLHRCGKLDMSTTATPGMSPIQPSIERAKAQFTRKKKKKAAETIKQ
ncbi:uncharacterized protein proca1 [Anabas testudineus]|nr:uncharacterized protein proca1 [Anabas testudineus]